MSRTAPVVTGQRGRLVNVESKEFFEVAVAALLAEDLALRLLLKGRLSHGDYQPGLGTAYETGAVYTVFKALLASPFSKKWNVDWEDRHGVGHKRIDLTYHRHHMGLDARVGVEVKWWSKGGYGIVDDCRKLLAAPGLSHRYVLVLRAWNPGRSEQALSFLLDRLLKGRRCSQLCVEREQYYEAEVLSWFGEPGKLGFALVQTWDG